MKEEIDSDAVKARITEELGDHRESGRSWQFGELLSDPPYRSNYQESDGSSSEYWVVLVERGDGYHVIYDSSDDMFGLATSGVVVGWFGRLSEAIEGM